MRYIEGHKKQIRLWGVDAPETHEAGYDRAKKKLLKLAKGEQLSCEVKDIDKYGRTVARCFQTNTAGVMQRRQEINKMMIVSGSTKEYCRFTKGFYGYCR